MKMQKQVLKILRKWFRKNEKSITDWEIKNKLSKKYGHLDVTMHMVSSTMKDIKESDIIPGLIFKVTEYHTEYSTLANNKPKKLPKILNIPTSKITKTNLIKLVETTKGMFINLTYIKKNSELGSTNGQFLKIDQFGYILIRTPKGTPKRVNTQTLKGGRIKKINYVV